MDPLDVLLYAAAITYGLVCIFAGYRRIELVIAGLPPLTTIAAADALDVNRFTGISIAFLVLILCLLVHASLVRDYAASYYGLGLFALYVAAIALAFDYTLTSLRVFPFVLQLCLYVATALAFVLYARYAARTSERLRLVHTTTLLGTLVVAETFNKGHTERNHVQCSLLYTAGVVVVTLLGVWYQTRFLQPDARLSLVSTAFSEITTPRPEVDEWVSTPYYMDVLVQDEAELDAMKAAICRNERLAV
ncbi:hypothetical protein SPRG_01730 [Saprolegnia parasitica CBS 223.65]|uniref:DUF4203 domain-containing protein n=1 Tax=Saprolegnia parasitica (strain CBS 223.65) TaxID=695850 RepID=A0A067D565_SAPPC|nr:hypothetical protein SPRG_01730 [Saprolegnia parasitica CBS 223.65]KDO33851.1 hypothetical protein SPRG_01730 [Saprolegnia parasitica CBS 223.65]|eukprot:XP_012195487.1 hypothetical protein SPRG_01730 [Saprolegnia parasitica CBS 223.65]